LIFDFIDSVKNLRLGIRESFMREERVGRSLQRGNQQGRISLRDSITKLGEVEILKPIEFGCGDG